MAQKIFTINSKENDPSLALTTLVLFSFFLWVNVAVSAAPPAPKIGDDRRIPRSDELFDPSKEWREPEQPGQSWRTEESLTRKNKKKGRFEDKRFKPYYYDPEKEGEKWDPYSRKDRDFDSKPATIFRFQF